MRLPRLPLVRVAMLGTAVALTVLAGSVTAQNAKAPSDKPGAVNGVAGHVPDQLEQAQDAPLGSAQRTASKGRDWLAPGADQVMPAFYEVPNSFGRLGIVNASGPVRTKGHAFFTPGPNGRACVTCHQPGDGMSLSAETAQQRWKDTGGKDPLFAPIDGSNCPSLPQDKPESHSLLLNRGLFRVFLPWPPKAADGTPMTPEFKLEVVKDPTGCNTDAEYGMKSKNPMVSIYRRPRIVANLKYILPPYAQYFNLKTGEPLAKDPETGARVSMNIMSDARHLTLKTQAVEAGITHMQTNGKLSPEQLAQIEAFERQIYMAQAYSNQAGSLIEAGGPPGLGPFAMQNGKYGLGNVMANPVFGSFDPWRPKTGETPKTEQAAFRASVARGQDVFFVRPFLIRNARGINDIGLGNPLKRSCATCHGAAMTGHDVAPSWIDLGSQNYPSSNDAPDLPLFKVTCRDDVTPHPFRGRLIYTYDPGRALITGRCRDVGAINLQQMRGLAARAPYFSNGTIPSLRALVDYYDRRFSIGYTEQERTDLVNFLSTL